MDPWRDPWRGVRANSAGILFQTLDKQVLEDFESTLHLFIMRKFHLTNITVIHSEVIGLVDESLRVEFILHIALF